MPRIQHALSLLVVLVSLAPLRASATVALHLDAATQAARSDLVVLARVRGQEVLRGKDGLPYTHTTLIVERSLKGTRKAGEAVVVRQMGGTLDGKTLTVPGDARFEVGERVVVFLADREPGTGVLFLTALGQSKLHVAGRARDGDLILQRQLGGLLLLDRAHRPVQPDPRTTLRTLRQVIAAGIEQRSTGKGVRP
ncbi:MAG: hypothetical protein D6729_11590 [Deltaproteobacteria bacterium]|nr:MAG: hypothetical protein D6729_11590 [Deltaproteobacteria bacterium]